MKKNIIVSENAPKAIGAYSQGIKYNGLIFLSGQIAMDRETFEIISTDVEIQTKAVLENISALLCDAGSKMENVIKVTIFLTDMNNFSRVNTIYGNFFKSEPPARSCVGVLSLPKGALVEIEVTAYEN